MIIEANGSMEGFFDTFMTILRGTFSLNMKWATVGFVILTLYYLVRGTKKERIYFSLQNVVLMGVILNPWIMYYLSRWFGMASRYYRLLWVIPLMITYAYFFANLICFRTNKAILVLGYIFSFVILVYGATKVMATTSTIYTGVKENTGMMMVDNLYKIEDDVKDAADIIEQDKQDETKIVRVLYDYDIWLEIRMYDASICPILSNGAIFSVHQKPKGQNQMDDAVTSEQWYDVLNYLVNSGGPNETEGYFHIGIETIMTALEKTETDYIIVEKENKHAESFTMAAEQIGETENYLVLKAR